MRECLLYSSVRDLVKDDPLRTGFIDFSSLHQMPGNGFALAIWIGREVNLRGVLHRFAQILHGIALIVGHTILRLEVVLDIDRKLRDEQVAHMAF